MSLRSTRKRFVQTNQNEQSNIIKKPITNTIVTKTEIRKNQNTKNVTIKKAPAKIQSNVIENPFIEKNKKKKPIALIVVLVVIEVFTLTGIFAAHYFVKIANLPQKVDYTPTTYIPPGMSVSDIERINKFVTIAVFGLDSRDSSLGKGNNSDVIILASIDYNSGEIKLVSVYRDTYLNIIKPNIYTKINSAYMHGGPQNAINALNKNLDLNIQNYFSFNWKSVADGIDLLGGVDLEISPQEFIYMNSFIHETCVKAGISKDNPAAMYIEHIGYQHLNGVQAVAYCRLRKMDSDVERVKRQKKVIELCLNKAKQTDISVLLQIATTILPEVQYYFDYNDLMSIIAHIKGFKISETTAFPTKLLGERMGPSGDSIIPYTLESNVSELHKLLYNAKDYTPSSTVRNYSNNIMEKYRQYRDENKAEKELKKLKNTKPVETKAGHNEDNIPVNNDESEQTETQKQTEKKQNKNTDPNKAIRHQNETTEEEIVIPNLDVIINEDVNNSNESKKNEDSANVQLVPEAPKITNNDNNKKTTSDKPIYPGMDMDNKENNTYPNEPENDVVIDSPPISNGFSVPTPIFN